MEESYSLPLSASPGFSSPPSSGMYNLSSGCFGPAQPREASGLVSILAGKRSLFTSHGTRCQSDSILVRSHTPLSEVAWGLLLPRLSGRVFRLTVCECVQDPKMDAACFHGVSVPGRSCSTFVWSMAGCRTWTWAPGGSRPQCSHLYTLQGETHV